MIHEIFPDSMDNQYKNLPPQEEDFLCLFYRREIFLKVNSRNEIFLPQVKNYAGQKEELIYLFSISGRNYFMINADESKEKAESLITGFTGGCFLAWHSLRDGSPRNQAFAVMTAFHLSGWYRSVTFCGCCGAKAVHDDKERMMRCPKCGNVMFPKISPAVVVAVTDGERLLLTRYADKNSARNYALVAGFVEIGETPEECAAREVMEEVGIRIKNIRYFGSQPWGYVGNLMMGFTAELDGTAQITLDQKELSEAVWLYQAEVPEIEDYSSLTREMIRRFKKGKLFTSPF